MEFTLPMETTGSQSFARMDQSTFARTSSQQRDCATPARASVTMMRHDSDDNLLEAVHASWRELARSRVDPDLQIMGTTDMPDRGGKYGKVAVALFDNDDRLRGFVRMDHDQKVDRHVIYYTEIDEVHRGRGLGRELYVAAHGFAQSLGSDGLMSDTSRSPDSERLWKSLATAGLARYQVMFKGIVPGTSFGAWTMELSGDSSSRSVGS